MSTEQLDYEERRLSQISHVLKQKNLTVHDCPCCGMSATLDKLVDEDEYTISCDNRACGLQQVAQFNLEGAVAAWNRRSTVEEYRQIPQLVARILAPWLNGQLSFQEWVESVDKIFPVKVVGAEARKE